MLRSGGLLIAKRSDVVPGVTYAWDPSFDARMQLAQQQAYALAQGGKWAGQLSGRSFFGELQAAGPWQRLDVWNVLVERLAPVPAICALNYRQNFGLFTGGFLRDVVDTADWLSLARLYDFESPDDLFWRSDGYFVRVFTVAVAMR